MITSGVRGELVEKVKGGVLNIAGRGAEECAQPSFAARGRAAEFRVIVFSEESSPVKLAAKLLDAHF